jgi:hypothetical protein
MVAVQADRSSCGFQSTHAIPEGRIGRRNLQFRVLVVGDNGQDRVQAELFDQRLKLLPALGTDGGTEIVDAEQVLRRRKNYAAASCAKARARSFRLQYQR